MIFENMLPITRKYSEAQKNQEKPVEADNSAADNYQTNCETRECDADDHSS